MFGICFTSTYLYIFSEICGRNEIFAENEDLGEILSKFLRNLNFMDFRGVSPGLRKNAGLLIRSIFDITVGTVP